MHYLLSPENKKAQEKAERIYDLLNSPPKTHKEVVDRINVIYEIKQILV